MFAGAEDDDAKRQMTGTHRSTNKQTNNKTPSQHNIPHHNHSNSHNSSSILWATTSIATSPINQQPTEDNVQDEGEGEEDLETTLKQAEDSMNAIAAQLAGNHMDPSSSSSSSSSLSAEERAELQETYNELALLVNTLKETLAV